MLANVASVGHAGNVHFDDSDRADESQVEDRRGARFPGGRVGAGVGGLGLVGGAIYLALQLLASGGKTSLLAKALHYHPGNLRAMLCGRYPVSSAMAFKTARLAQVGDWAVERKIVLSITATAQQECGFSNRGRA